MEMNQIKAPNITTGASLLDTLTSALYADPIVVFREYVQNSVDSFTRHSRDTRDTSIDLKVEIIINSKDNQIIIRDNGKGIDPNKFQDVMYGFGNSEKMGDKSQLGFRGIGRLSGLSFCDTLQFINKADPENPQFFSLKGKYYHEILTSANGGNVALEEVLKNISTTKRPQKWSDPDPNNLKPGFEVIMGNVCEELWACICSSKNMRRRQKTQAVEATPLSIGDRRPTDNFVNELSMLLPVPYRSDFNGASDIREKYKEFFNTELSDREFKVLLDGQLLFKPFVNMANADFKILPIQILPASNNSEALPREYKTIGLLWMRFDYVFKAMKENWGIAVRSKNMLVRGGAVLAEEAAEDRDAITTYGQYLSAIKGVTGELLLETGCLDDNSRRDWFKIDKNSLQLRNQLCQLMNRMHTYRYKISRYMHNDMRTEAEKQSVIQAYRELVSPTKEGSDITAVEQFIDGQFQMANAIEIDDRADERDILGYTMTQKQFYKKLMMEIYDYFKDDDIKEYYALKTYILRNLNQDSIESDNESTIGNK